MSLGEMNSSNPYLFPHHDVRKEASPCGYEESATIFIQSAQLSAHGDELFSSAFSIPLKTEFIIIDVSM